MKATLKKLSCLHRYRSYFLLTSALCRQLVTINRQPDDVPCRLDLFRRSRSALNGNAPACPQLARDTYRQSPLRPNSNSRASSLRHPHSFVSARRRHSAQHVIHSSSNLSIRRASASSAGLPALACITDDRPAPSPRPTFSPSATASAFSHASRSTTDGPRPPAPSHQCSPPRLEAIPTSQDLRRRGLDEATPVVPIASPSRQPKTFYLSLSPDFSYTPIDCGFQLQNADCNTSSKIAVPIFCFPSAIRNPLPHCS